MSTNIEHMTEVLKAFSKGKTIQFRRKFMQDRDWEDTKIPSWDFEHCEYRIKPEPQYRPYKSAKEFFTALEQHGKFLINDDLNGYFAPLYIDDSCVVFYSHDDGTLDYTYQDLFDEWSHQDGTVCGLLTMETHE